MFSKGVAVFVFLVNTVSASTVSEAFVKHEVDKTLSIKAPEGLIEVNCADVNVQPGQKLNTGVETLTEPEISFYFDLDEHYCLVMVDPDAPSRAFPVMGEMVHWIMGNIAGDTTKGQGEEVLSYRAPNPLPKSGEHRYVFLLYKQPGKIDFSKNADVKAEIERSKFSVSEFAKKYNLGDPVAGNFYLYALLSETDGIVKPLPEIL